MSEELQRPMSMRSLPGSSANTRPQSRIFSKVGVVQSKKFAGMKAGQPTWEEVWTPAHLKVFNGMMRLEQGDKEKQRDGVVAWEMYLPDIKLITPANDQGEFFVTAKHDGVKLVSMGEEDASATIMRGVQEQELIGSSGQDLVFLFKTDKAAADEWTKFLQTSKAELEQDGGIDAKKKSIERTDSYGAFKARKNLLGTRKGKGTRRKNKGTGRKKAPRKMMARPVFTPRKQVQESMLDPVFGVFRGAAIVGCAVAVCTIGPLLIVYLLVTNASKRKKRDYFNRLQEVLTQAIIWILPSYALHISGEAPTSYVSNIVYDEAGKVRNQDKASSKAKIMILNRSSHADFLAISSLSNEIEHAGHVRAILRGRKQLLRYIPFVGLILQRFRFMFLSGNKYKDSPVVKSYMKRLSQQRAEWLVFFPEPGPTPITKEGIIKSQKNADELGRPVLSKVALPNSDLLETCLNNLTEALEDGEDAEVYDITLAYSGYKGEFGTDANPFARPHDKRIPSASSILFNKASRDFHIHSRVYSLRELQATIDGPEGIEEWLDERFQEKDERLKYFIEHQTFVDPNSTDVKDSKAELVQAHGSIENMLYLWGITLGIFLVIIAVIILILVLT